MKKIMVATMVAALAGLGSVAWAERPDDAPRGAGGPKKEMGQQGPGARLMGPDGARQMAGHPLQRLLDNPKKMKELGITDAQAAALKASFHEMEKKMIALRSEADLARLDVRKLTEQDDVDEAALMAAIEKAGQAQTAIQKAAASQRLAVKKIVGPEVSAKLKERMGERMRERREDGKGPGVHKDGKDGKGGAPWKGGGPMEPPPGDEPGE